MPDNKDLNYCSWQRHQVSLDQWNRLTCLSPEANRSCWLQCDHIFLRGLANLESQHLFGDRKKSIMINLTQSVTNNYQSLVLEAQCFQWRNTADTKMKVVTHCDTALPIRHRIKWQPPHLHAERERNWNWISVGKIKGKRREKAEKINAYL